LSLGDGYTANLYKYLITTFPHVNLKQDKRSWLKFDKTGTLLYVNGSKKHDTDTGWYDLDESIYNSLASADSISLVRFPQHEYKDLGRIDPTIPKLPLRLVCVVVFFLSNRRL